MRVGGLAMKEKDKCREAMSVVGYLLSFVVIDELVNASKSPRSSGTSQPGQHLVICCVVAV